jgi:hypothetical protein
MKSVTFHIPDDRDNLYEVIKYPAGEIQVRLTPAGIAACDGKEEYVITANPIPDIIELAQLLGRGGHCPRLTFGLKLC